MKILEQKAQGDFLVSKIESLPSDLKLKPLEREVVGEGEASNHFHVLEKNEQSEVVYSRDEQGRVFMHIMSGSATLGHWRGATKEKADHEALTFTPGFYLISPQREYDEMGDRKVVD